MEVESPSLYSARMRPRIAAIVLLLSAPTMFAAPPVDRAAMAAKVRAEFLHSWKAYEQYAWGHDELRPLTKQPRDWYGQSLLMTPVDSLDTLLLMGFNNEAAKAKTLIADQLSFDKDINVKVFEVTIRLLGGLLSGYQLTGDARLLHLAYHLGP